MRDALTRFLLPQAGVRGVHVVLDETWSQIRQRGDAPTAVSELLGEAAAASALLASHAKIEGRLSIQLRGQDALRTLFAECTAAGTLRGIARVDATSALADSRDLRELAGDAVLAITIEHASAGGRDPMRYQGLVPLDSDTLSGALESYFRQSEQLPTRLLLAADGATAAGLMLQKLPGDGGDADGWALASALFDTLEVDELLATDPDTLLFRLFHEQAPEVLGRTVPRFACSCSHERVAAMLQSLGVDEARASVIDGAARVRCEFCGQQYAFTREEIDALFRTPTPTSDPPESLQ